jgi:hypothetical protein
MATPTGNLTPKNSIISDSLYNANTGTGSGHIAFDEANLLSGDSQKNEIRNYIRLRLGDGMVDFDADKEHMDMGIKQALIQYRALSSNGVEESYAFLDLLPETQEYILPREIEDVNAIYRRGIGSVSGTTASQFEPFASGYLNTYMLQAGRVGGLAGYELYAGYQELAMTMFGGYMNFTWNRVTKKLTVIRKLPFLGAENPDTISEGVMLSISNQKPDVMLLNDRFVYPWVQDYALGFTMISIGNAREKFSSIAGPQGGSSLNGTALKAEGQALIDKLLVDIRQYSDGQMPMWWVIG